MQQHDTDENAKPAKLWGLQYAILKAIAKSDNNNLSRSGILAKARQQSLEESLEMYLDDLQARKLVLATRASSRNLRWGEMFSVTSAGRVAMQAHLDRAAAAELYSQPAPPPTRDIFSGIYRPDQTGFVRNDGHKHLHSAGASRC